MAKSKKRAAAKPGREAHNDLGVYFLLAVLGLGMAGTAYWQADPQQRNELVRAVGRYWHQIKQQTGL